jgi:uncharacterized coiled-coil protein SlyX
MPKVVAHTPVLKKKFNPFVSVCTPTFNRRPFIETMFECFRNQTYPKDRMEWIIVDDGTDKIRDLVEASGIPQIKYFELKDKMTLGAKRNYMHKQVKGTIVVYMDDDDYYPPDRVSHAVEMLTKHKDALCAGSSELYIYYKHIQQMYQCGPYGPNHATAGTFAFKTELLKQTSYEEHACLAEEKHFLKNYTIPFVQLDPLKSILVFSHDQNTFDKKKLIGMSHESVFKPSDKPIEMFIKFKHEEKIKHFFLNEIEDKLKNYKPGDPSMKPDVLKQMKQIEDERAQMMANHNMNMNGPIMMSRPGEPPIALTSQQVVELVEFQKQTIETQNNKIVELEKMIKMLQKQIVFKSNQLNNMNKFIENLQPRNGLSSENPHVENIPVVKEKETTKAIENEIIFDIPKKSEPMYKI